MGNKVKYNLKNVHAAKLTKAADGVVQLRGTEGHPRCGQHLSGRRGRFLAVLRGRHRLLPPTSNNGYSGDLEMALIPEWFRTEILKEALDKNGVLVERSDITETEKFALLFEFDGDVRAIRHVLYNCSASRPSIESETKEDTIEPGTETLSLTADPREDGLVKSRTGDSTADTTYQNWYKAVYTPQPATATSK